MIRKFLRPKILLTCYALVFLGSAAVGDVTLKTVLAIFVIAAWYVHAAGSNDYADRHIDQINLKGARDRPLLTENISYKKFWIINSLAGLIAIGLSFPYGLGAVLFTAVILLLNYAYSFQPIRISYRGIVSQLMLPIAYVAYPLALGYWATDPQNAFPWALGAGIYIGFIARLFLKDFRDVKGDRKHGKKTFLVRHGAVKTCIAAGISSIVSTLIVASIVHDNPAVLAILCTVQLVALHQLLFVSRARLFQHQKQHIIYIAKLANVSVITLLAYFLCQQQANVSSAELMFVPASIGLLLLGATLLGHPQRSHATISK